MDEIKTKWAALVGDPKRIGLIASIIAATSYFTVLRSPLGVTTIAFSYSSNGGNSTRTLLAYAR
jgi:hypothetical protein